MRARREVIAAAPPEKAAARLIDSLARTGLGVERAFLPPELVASLRTRLGELEAAGRFRAAAVGAGAQRAVRPALRGDRLCWLDPPLVQAEEELLARAELLRAALNGALALGLFDLECQYAIYPPGGVYVRHLDRSAAGAERVLSVLLYLNEDWSAADGGALRLYADAGSLEVIPEGGTLVIFDSARFEHEVLPARRDRFSVAGWFRRRARLPAGH